MEISETWRVHQKSVWLRICKKKKKKPVCFLLRLHFSIIAREVQPSCLECLKKNICPLCSYWSGLNSEFQILKEQLLWKQLSQKYVQSFRTHSLRYEYQINVVHQSDSNGPVMPWENRLGHQRQEHTAVNNANRLVVKEEKKRQN